MSERKSDPSPTFKEVLDYLIYEDGESKEMTLLALKKLGDVVGDGGPGALILQGIRWHNVNGRASFKYFQEAENLGSTRPLLNYFIANSLRTGAEGVEQDLKKAMEYFQKAVQGGCDLGHIGIYSLYSEGYGDPQEGGEVKALKYLEDLDQNGRTSGIVLCILGDCYKEGMGCERDHTKAREYYQRAANMGYAPAYISIHALYWWYGRGGVSDDPDKAMMALLTAEDKGVKDDRILGKLLESMYDVNVSVSDHVLTRGKFHSKEEMALYYCDVLIQRGSPKGYSWKAKILGEVTIDGQNGEADALGVLIDADNAGLATFSVYISLASAYMQAKGVPVDGAAALEYLEKALEVASHTFQQAQAYAGMAQVYAEGIPPIPKDDVKAQGYWDKEEELK